MRPKHRSRLARMGAPGSCKRMVYNNRLCHELALKLQRQQQQREEG